MLMPMPMLALALGKRRKRLAGIGTGGIVGAARPHLEPRLLDWSV